jgi:Transposase DNA-binding/Transposase Tn5 dimerisation domain/Transposase DDE domain
MNPSTLLSPQQWAEYTFGSVHLGDQRRTQRAIEIAASIARHPSASLPRQMPDEAALHAAYRFLQNPHVSYEQLIRPYLKQTREAAGQHSQVLLIQDTTDLDYHAHPTTTGLGPIGSGSHQGFLLQTVLAVLPESREVLGIAQQEPFLRQPAPKGETKRQRQERERESQVWERSIQALGSPPAGVQWIHVGDRGSDIFSFLSLCRELGCDFVVRAAQDRCVDLLVEQADTPVAPRSHHGRPAAQAEKSLHLFEVVRGWEAQGQQDLELESTQTYPKRVAHLCISWSAVRLLPPRAQEGSGLRPLVVWVVRVWEPEPPEGIEALEWVLLTSVPTHTSVHAWQRVAWYRVRWIVEDFHQGLKTGCRVEQRQIQTYEGLRTLLGLLSPEAVRLLQLRTMARQAPEQPAQQVLPADLVQVVAHLAHVPAAQLTTKQCWHTMARQGGYLGRKGDGPPGWKTLWLGWFYVQSLLEGVHLATLLSVDSSSDP